MLTFMSIGVVLLVLIFILSLIEKGLTSNFSSSTMDLGFIVLREIRSFDRDIVDFQIDGLISKPPFRLRSDGYGVVSFIYWIPMYIPQIHIPLQTKTRIIVTQGTAEITTRLGLGSFVLLCLLLLMAVVYLVGNLVTTSGADIVRESILFTILITALLGNFAFFILVAIRRAEIATTGVINWLRRNDKLVDPK